MSGRLQGHVTVDRRGVYRYNVIFSKHRAGSIRWIPSGTRVTVAPKGTFARQDLYGRATPTRAGAHLRIGYSPVMIEYRR
jgi:hypothetical protein